MKRDDRRGKVVLLMSSLFSSKSIGMIMDPRERRKHCTVRFPLFKTDINRWAKRIAENEGCTVSSVV